jgi:hypothetical protein
LTRRGAAALALVLAGPASAQDAGTLVRGDVVRSATDGTPPQLVVRLDEGAEVEGSRYRWPTIGRDLARGLPRGARIRLEVEADADGKPLVVTSVF